MRVLANIVALVHGLVVLPMLVIGPIALFFIKERVIWLERTYLIIGIATIVSFILTGGCYLTDLEQNLRLEAGQPSYTSGFVRHYLGLVGIDMPDLATTITLTLLLIAGMGRLIYLRFYSQNPRRDAVN